MMDSRGFKRRLTKLETARLVEPVILYFTDGNKTPMTIAGTTKNFFRLCGAMEEYGRPGGLLRGPLLQLYLVRRAVRIEGTGAEAFLLLQALLQGPVTPNNPNPETGGIAL
jgi:hypothetical protein